MQHQCEAGADQQRLGRKVRYNPDTVVFISSFKSQLKDVSCSFFMNTGRLEIEPQYF